MTFKSYVAVPCKALWKHGENVKGLRGAT